jgi:hypothetical protein
VVEEKALKVLLGLKDQRAPKDLKANKAHVV